MTKIHDLAGINRLSKHVHALRSQHFPHKVDLPKYGFFHNKHHEWLTQNMGPEGLRFAPGDPWDTRLVTVKKNSRWTLDGDSVCFAHADDAVLFKLTWC